MAFERVQQVCEALPGLSSQQHAAGARVQPVGKARRGATGAQAGEHGVRADTVRVPVDRYAGRLFHRQHALVLVEDAQRGGQVFIRHVKGHFVAAAHSCLAVRLDAVYPHIPLFQRFLEQGSRNAGEGAAQIGGKRHGRHVLRHQMFLHGLSSLCFRWVYYTAAVY